MADHDPTTQEGRFALGEELYKTVLKTFKALKPSDKTHSRVRHSLLDIILMFSYSKAVQQLSEVDPGDSPITEVSPASASKIMKEVTSFVMSAESGDEGEKISLGFILGMMTQKVFAQQLQEAKILPADEDQDQVGSDPNDLTKF